MYIVEFYVAIQISISRVPEELNGDHVIMYVSVVLALLSVATATDADLIYETVEAKEGSNSKMTCSLTPIYSPDKVSLLLWYRGNSNRPFYKYDARTASPEHWSDPSMENKYHLQISNDERAELSIASISLMDEDVYQCQVEFFRSSSTVTYVNLTVVGKYIPSYKIYIINA